MASAPKPSIVLPFPAPAETLHRCVPSDRQELERETVALFEEYGARLLRYTLSFGLPIHDAEDIVQEVFLSLSRHLELGSSNRNPRGWIFRVAHNLALKQRGANHRRMSVVDSEGMYMEEPVDAGPNPEEQVAMNQRRKRLLAAVRALPEQDQQCLALRAEGLRYREIAQVLGMSLGAVSNSLTRSLMRLGCADEF